MSFEVATDPDEIAGLHRQFQAWAPDTTGNETLSSILRPPAPGRERPPGVAQLRSLRARDVTLRTSGLLDALERDSDMAKSIATVQVDDRRRWIEHLRNTRPARPDDAASPHGVGDDRGPVVSEAPGAG